MRTTQDLVIDAVNVDDGKLLLSVEQLESLASEIRSKRNSAKDRNHIAALWDALDMVEDALWRTKGLDQ